MRVDYIEVDETRGRARMGNVDGDLVCFDFSASMSMERVGSYLRASVRVATGHEPVPAEKVRLMFIKDGRPRCEHVYFPVAGVIITDVYPSDIPPGPYR
jgi:hypothetical protein